MASSLPVIEIFGDLDERKLTDANGGDRTLPAFFPDLYSFKLKLLKRDQDGTLQLIHPNVSNVSVSVGPVYVEPTSGLFKLKFGNSGTHTEAIQFNEAADDFKTKLGALTESTTYGLEEVYSPAPSTWMCRFNNAVTNPLQAADNSLEPETFIRVTDIVQNAKLWQEIRLLQAPVASTSQFDQILATPPTVRRIREGSTFDDGITITKINEVQAVLVPPDFLGTFALKYQGQQTRLLSVTDSSETFQSAMNALYRDTSTRFVVTNPELHNAYVEFTGPLSGQPQPLLEVVIGSTGDSELTFDLDFATTEVAAALRTSASVSAIMEAKLVITDPNIVDDPGEALVLFQSVVEIKRPLQWTGLEAAAGIDWLRPANPIDYLPFDIDQVLTGQQQAFPTLIGNGTATSFDIAHNLNSDVCDVIVMEVSSKRRLRDDEYSVVFSGLNNLTISGFSSTPTTNKYKVVVIAVGPASVFQSHTHPIGHVVGLQGKLDQHDALIAQLQALLPFQLPASPNDVINPFKDSSDHILSISINPKSELIPLTRPAQNIDLLKLVATNAAMPRPGYLLTAIHRKPDCTLIAGAGTTTVNGNYPPDGSTLNGKPKYQLDGGVVDNDSVTWSGTAWVVKHGGVSKYQSTDNVAYPWLATTWTVTGGTTSVPTVTASYPYLPTTLPLASTVTGKIFIAVTGSATTIVGGSGLRGDSVAIGDYIGCDGRLFYKITRSDPPTSKFPGAIVSGSGTATNNGTYLPDGVRLNNKPKYQLDGGTADDDSITWSGTAWVIKKGGVSQYQSTNDVAYPWLVTTWTATGGSSPVPTVVITPYGISFYPVAFDRELFRIAINDAMFKVDCTVTLRFGIWAQLFRNTSNAEYTLVVEFASLPQQGTPSPAGTNLQDIVWDSNPVLQQRLVLSETGIQHPFGVQVVRRSDGTLRTNKKIYGTVLAGDTIPASATFAVRARLVQFDTENSISDSKGLVYYRLEASSSADLAVDIDSGAQPAL